MARAELEIRLRLEDDGRWLADRKRVRRGISGYATWEDGIEVSPERAIVIAEAVGKGNEIRAMFRAWARDAEEQAKAQEENLVREAGIQHERLVSARERAAKARLAVDVLAGPEDVRP